MFDPCPSNHHHHSSPHVYFDGFHHANCFPMSQFILHFLTRSSRGKYIQISGSIESETENTAEKAQEHQGHRVPSLCYRPKFGEQSLCIVKMSAVCFLRKGIFIDKTQTSSAPHRQPKHELTNSGTWVHMAHRILPSTHFCLQQGSCSLHSRWSLHEESHLSPSTEKGAANCSFTGRRV